MKKAEKFPLILRQIIAVTLSAGAYFAQPAAADPLIQNSNREKLPIRVQQFVESEQIFVTRSVNPQLLSTGEQNLPIQYLPEGRAVFELPSYWVPENEAELIGLNSKIFRKQDGYILTYVHPLVPQQKIPKTYLPGPTFMATPTSSARTLVVWEPHQPQKPFQIKVSIPRIFSGVLRTIKDAEVREATFITSAVESKSKELGIQSPIIHESSGITTTTGIGNCIERDLSTMHSANVIPLYALYSKGKLATDTILDQWLSTSESPRDFAKSLTLKLLYFLTQAQRDLGVTSDMHGQNILALMGSAGPIDIQFRIRDVNGIYLNHEAYHNLSQGAISGRKFQNQVTISLESYVFGSWIYNLNLHLRKRGIQGVSLNEYRRWVKEANTPQTTTFVKTPLHTWMLREQHLNLRIRDTELFNEVDFSAVPKDVDPKTGSIVVAPYLVIPIGETHILGDKNLGRFNKILDTKIGNTTAVRFFFHPTQSHLYAKYFDKYPPQIGKFRMTPTSSPRSFLVWDSTNPSDFIGLKLSMDMKVLDLSRLNHISKLRRATFINEILSKIPQVDLDSEGFDFLTEPTSLHLKDLDHGTIVRELKSEREQDSLNQYWPGFSLIAKDPSGTSAFDRLLANSSDREIVEEIAERILWPILKTYAYLMFRQGLSGDAHQQNVLVKWSDQTGVEKVRIRDADSFRPDIDYRLKLGLSVGDLGRHEEDIKFLKLREGPQYYDSTHFYYLRNDWITLLENGLKLNTARRNEIKSVLDKHKLWAAFDRLMFRALARHFGDKFAFSQLRRQLPDANLKDSFEEFQKDIRGFLNKIDDKSFWYQSNHKTPMLDLNSVMKEAIRDLKQRTAALAGTKGSSPTPNDIQFNRYRQPVKLGARSCAELSRGQN